MTSFIVEAGIIGLPAFSATIGVWSPTFSITTLIADKRHVGAREAGHDGGRQYGADVDAGCWP